MQYTTTTVVAAAVAMGSGTVAPSAVGDDDDDVRTRLENIITVSLAISNLKRRHFIERPAAAV